MKVLVTGGAGFIGSHLVDELINQGHDVLVVDNLITGSKHNININAVFKNIDIRSEQLQEVFFNFRPDVVYHLAAQVSVNKSQMSPLYDEEVNIHGTLNVLEQCKKFKIKQFVYSSSAAVYGSPAYLPVDEKHQTKPESFYGITKLTPELYIKIYSNLYNFKYNILRYSNVYGPRQSYLGEGGVISIFLNNIIENKKIKVFGDGEQTRDFIFVKDVVEANLACLYSRTSGTYNISTKNEVSINEVLTVLKAKVDLPLVVEYKESRYGDIENSCLDNTLSAENLHWRPEYKLEEGLSETFNYYSEKATTQI